MLHCYSLRRENTYAILCYCPCTICTILCSLVFVCTHMFNVYVVIKTWIQKIVSTFTSSNWPNFKRIFLLLREKTMHTVEKTRNLHFNVVLTVLTANITMGSELQMKIIQLTLCPLIRSRVNIFSETISVCVFCMLYMTFEQFLYHF